MQGRIDTPTLLAQWRSRELRIARSFKECSRATPAELEELLDSTTLALLDKTYEDPEHLRAALHRGIKMRALRLHRDRITRHNTLQAAAHAQQADEHARAWEQDPQHAILEQEDRIIIREFLAELTPTEQQTFALIADGQSWRAIATTLGIPPTQARNTTRACERKRERFFTLYQTGRLCGYRSQTITALLDGTHTSQLALNQALAHIRHCHTCQTQHHTTEAKLRAAFDKHALALLPAPILTHPTTGILDRIYDFFTRHARVLNLIPTSQIHEHLAETIAGAGATIKVAVGVLGATALASGAISHRHAHDLPSTPTPRGPTVAVLHPQTPARARPTTLSSRRKVQPHHHTATHPHTQRHQVTRSPIPSHRSIPSPPRAPTKQTTTPRAGAAEEEFGFEPRPRESS